MAATLDLVEVPINLPEPMEQSSARSPAKALIMSCQSPETRRSYISELEQLALLLGHDRDAWLDIPWHKLGARMRGLYEMRCSMISPASAGKTRSVLRGLLKEAWIAELITADQRDRWGRLPRKNADKRPTGRVVPLDEITRMLKACRRDEKLATGVRDALVLGLGFHRGLRRTEICSLAIRSLLLWHQKCLLFQLPEWSRSI